VIIGGMTLPPEFENELENWLNARLDERFERQQRAVLEDVVKMVAAMLNEQIRADGEVQKREFEGEFAKLQDIVDRHECIVVHMQHLIEQMRRLDRAAAHEGDNTKMN
jgi:hypothetical protein